jgi:anti-sigma regulatory factor (Ser/Thr protein kinase)
MIAAVDDVSQVAQARRLVGDHARRAGMAESRIAQVAIVVTELATNLLKHGGGGQILADRCSDGDGIGLEIMALDRGRGMVDVGRCMDDGYSTSGSPGTGLGAIARLADDVRIYSRPGLGSVVMARFLDRAAGARLDRSGIGPGHDGHRTLFGAAVAPYPGEQVCGDRWSFSETAQGRTLVVADGAGHGIEAARAANLAAQVFAEHAAASCVELVERMHRALAPTRGAAIAVARIDEAASTVRYVGVGNICGIMVVGDQFRHMVSHNGTAGHVAPRIREFTYDFTADPLVILHSDGLTSRWDLAAYPGLVGQHPSLIAGVLLRDHRRPRDDASVVAMRPLG